MTNIDLIRRISKGSPLTWPEVDGNWSKIQETFLGQKIERDASLTNADVGKILVLKDGKASLPEFVTGSSTPGNVSIDYSGSFVPFSRPKLIIEFTQNLVNFDNVEVTLRSETNAVLNVMFIAVESDDNATEFLIGANASETGVNFKEKLEAWMLANGAHQCYSVFYGDNTSIVIIEANVLELSRQSNFWEDTSASNAYISISRQGDNLADRANDALIAALLISAIRYDVDGIPITPINMASAIFALSENGTGTDEVFADTSPYGTYALPASKLEVLSSIQSALPIIFTGISNASVADNTIEFDTHYSISNFELLFDSTEEQSYFDTKFSSLEIEEGSGPGAIYCPYPIIGLLRGFATDGKALLCQDLICKLPLSGDSSIEMNGIAPLISVGRICCLDPEHPGRMKVASIEDVAFLQSIAPGYAFALEAASPNQEFWARLVIDVATLTIIIALSE